MESLGISHMRCVTLPPPPRRKREKKLLHDKHQKKGKGTLTSRMHLAPISTYSIYVACVYIYIYIHSWIQMYTHTCMDENVGDTLGAPTPKLGKHMARPCFLRVPVQLDRGRLSVVDASRTPGPALKCGDKLRQGVDGFEA